MSASTAPAWPLPAGVPQPGAVGAAVPCPPTRAGRGPALAQVILTILPGFLLEMALLGAGGVADPRLAEVHVQVCCTARNSSIHVTF